MFPKNIKVLLFFTLLFFIKTDFSKIRGEEMIDKLQIKNKLFSNVDSPSKIRELEEKGWSRELKVIGLQNMHNGLKKYSLEINKRYKIFFQRKVY